MSLEFTDFIQYIGYVNIIVFRQYDKNCVDIGYGQIHKIKMFVLLVIICISLIFLGFWFS